MQDNFNLAKYLRHGNHLLNENLGGYVDLKPINELEGQEKTPFGMPDTSEENPWMDEVDGMEDYTVGEWKCYYDYPGVLAWSYGDMPFDQLAVYATPNFDTDNATPIQVDVNNEPVENMSVPQGVFDNFTDYAEAMAPYLEKIKSKYAKDSMSLEELMGSAMEIEELEKPKSIYVTDDSEDEKGFIVPSDDDTIDTNRMMDLGGEEIEKGIMFLLDDGFDPEDVLEMCKMFIEGHADQGKKY